MSEEKLAGLTAARKGGAASATLRKEQAEKLDRFRAEVVRRVLLLRDGVLDPIDEFKVDALCGLYLVVIRRCRMSGGVNQKVNPLALSAAITGARGLLRDLQVTSDEESTDPNAPPGPHATPEERRAWSKRYVESVFADEGGPKQ